MYTSQHAFVDTCSAQFSSVAQSCPTLCDPVDCSMPGFPVHHQLLEFAQLMPIKSVMPSKHLILCCPLLLLPSIFPSIRVFSNESVLCIRWPKYWELQLQHLSWWIFRTDFLWDWLVWSLKGKPLQHSCLENPMNSMKRYRAHIPLNVVPKGARPLAQLDFWAEAVW